MANNNLQNTNMEQAQAKLKAATTAFNRALADCNTQSEELLKDMESYIKQAKNYKKFKQVIKGKKR